MKTRQELEFIENLVKRAYNNRNWGNILKEKLDKPYNPQNPELGYSYSHLMVKVKKSSLPIMLFVHVLELMILTIV